MSKVNKKHFLQSRVGLIIVGLLCFIGSWLVFLRASDTGSLQQYGILIVLIIVGLNRLYKAVRFN